MAGLDNWCDEATFVDWRHEGSELPDWMTSYERLIAGDASRPARGRKARRKFMIRA
jgi:hypothetical protein